MSLYLDVQYLLQIQHRLPLFKKKKDNTWICRCILCGDSKSNPYKTRGYFYASDNKLAYKCHNCGISQTFSYFLKQLDGETYGKYRLEKFREERGIQNATTPTKKSSCINTSTPVETGDLRRYKVIPINELTPEHPAVQYVTARQIPEQYNTYLSAVDNMQDILPYFGDKYNTITVKDARLVIPFYTPSNRVFALSLRSLNPTSKLRYITLQHTGDPLVFGQERLNMNKPFYVTEGPIDSLFLPNAIACAGTSFGSIEQLHLNTSNATIIFDNQPRNKEVCTLLEKYIDLNYRVCIWPSSIQAKDINQMVLEGYTNIEDIVKQHSFTGIEAKIKYTMWRKIR
jgi:hypothetical protein